MGKPYTQIYRREWVEPIRRGYKMGCCDCGLVHTMDFRLVGRPGWRVIQFRVARDPRATAQKRRHFRKTQQGLWAASHHPGASKSLGRKHQ